MASSPDPSASPAGKISCPAPAKINLALHVIDRRADGYHELDTLVVFCELSDRIDVAMAAPGASDQVSIRATGPHAGELPPGNANIVHLACTRLLERVASKACVEIIIDKHLPVASGIGGGSADAAAALIALSRLLGEAEFDPLLVLAEELGSDVPMCLHSLPLIARGRGEAIELLNDFQPLHLVLVNPGIAVKTPSVFRSLQNWQNPPLHPLPERPGALALCDWLAAQRNDLQPAAMSKNGEIGEVLDALADTGPLLARMSGSGATCFGIYDSEAAAEVARTAIIGSYPHWWAVVTVTGAFGPQRAFASETG